jgi:hypothetical protein
MHPQLEAAVTTVFMGLATDLIPVIQVQVNGLEFAVSGYTQWMLLAS